MSWRLSQALRSLCTGPSSCGGRPVLSADHALAPLAPTLLLAPPCRRRHQTSTTGGCWGLPGCCRCAVRAETAPPACKPTPAQPSRLPTTLNRRYWGRPEDYTGARRAYVWNRTTAASDMLGMVGAAGMPDTLLPNAMLLDAVLPDAQLTLPQYTQTPHPLLTLRRRQPWRQQACCSSRTTRPTLRRCCPERRPSTPGPRRCRVRRRPESRPAAIRDSDQRGQEMRRGRQAVQPRSGQHLQRVSLCRRCIRLLRSQGGTAPAFPATPTCTRAAGTTTS